MYDDAGDKIRVFRPETGLSTSERVDWQVAETAALQTF